MCGARPVLGFENIEYASLTDVGVRRSHNQDAHVVLPAGDAEHWRQRGQMLIPLAPTDQLPQPAPVPVVPQQPPPPP